jgi:hypothetical protein
MSGTISYLTIAEGMDTAKFELWNANDSIVDKITGMLNQYLPADKPFSQVATYTSIGDNEDDCLIYSITDKNGTIYPRRKK